MILAGDPAMFTFSIHGARNFAFGKERRDLDAERADGTGNPAFLDALERGACPALSVARISPRILPALSKGGLQACDGMAFMRCGAAAVLVAVAMGGGYARVLPIAWTSHFATVVAAARCAKAVPATILRAAKVPDRAARGSVFRRFFLRFGNCCFSRRAFCL